MHHREGLFDNRQVFFTQQGLGHKANFPMRYFSILEPPSKDFIKVAARNIRLAPERLEDTVHPQEDYLLISKTYPIFVVADGVTLEPEPEGHYPNPSGAGEVARIFCEVVKQSEGYYHQLNTDVLLQIFQHANHAVGVYNKARGRTKEASNFWDFDLFATTGAFVLIKDQIAYWATISDSYVMHFDKQGTCLLQSPAPWANVEKHLLANWRKLDTGERKRLLRRVYRNGADESGNLIGYGVVTGEDTAVRYLQYGTFVVRKGELVTVLTDGFEHYMRKPEFISLFLKGDDDLESQVRRLTATISQEDPEKFGHERSLIVISYSR